MAMQGASRTSGRSGSSLSTPSTLAEINVTPLVDVMLVLLIIFMISAPMMQQGVQVDLPKANPGALSEVPDQLVLTVNKAREISINGNVIETGTLRERLLGLSSAKPDIQIFIQADQAVPYGFIAQVMAEAKKAKINRLGLVTQAGDPNLKL
jgi:biopolymer transport protein TolR